MNKNAYIGKNSRLVAAISSGIHNKKVDVKLEFACGRNVDVNIKAFKVGLNQLTRTTPEKFCNHFDLDCLHWLQNLLVEKSKYGIDKYDFFPVSQREKAVKIFTPIARQIVEWSMSFKKSREILVLYDRQQSIMYIYLIKTILKNLKYDIDFSSLGGNLLIGSIITLKRKGGDGNSSIQKLKTDPTHPGNNIQLQLNIHKFRE